MKILAAQFSKISGPDAVSSYKVEFTVDESQRRGVQNLLSYKKGTSLLLFLYDVEKDEKKILEIKDETPDQTRTRFNKRMYALMRQIADEKDIEINIVKNSLKDFLKEKKMIKTSLKELDTNQIASAIYYLRTNYGQQ
jgi:hypothetical protein